MKERLHILLPAEMKEKLEEVCKKRGFTKTEFIKSLLRSEFDKIEKYFELKA